MEQSDTAIEVTVTKQIPNDAQFSENVDMTIELCDGYSVYLSYIYKEDIKRDYMNCTLTSQYVGS